MRKVLNKIKLEIKTQKNSNTRTFCMLYNPETQVFAVFSLVVTYVL